ncbi:MAG TPA: hypothetical protein VF982_05395 [Anaerolineales bacterium]|jgi:hypothetical protein|nr:hypothetical protein [Anaerolineales bacterium]
MAKPDSKSFATNPFVVTSQQSEKANAPKTTAKKVAVHMSKNMITREVLNKIIDRVKRI